MALDNPTSRPVGRVQPAAEPALDAPHVLVVEDECEISDVLLAYLRRDGLHAAWCGNGARALAEIDLRQPDLVLLDIQLPGMDGFDVLRQVRAHGDTPVILLTAFVDDVDRLLGLRLGADDYITKPFVPAEVVARVRAVLRRSRRGPQAAPSARPAPLRYGALVINTEANSAAVECAEGTLVPLPLTLTEFRLLACLVAHPKRVLSRQTLIDQCLPESDAFDRVIDSHLSRLRRKLAAAGLGELIDTVRGVGYRLATD